MLYARCLSALLAHRENVLTNIYYITQREYWLDGGKDLRAIRTGFTSRGRDEVMLNVIHTKSSAAAAAVASNTINFSLNIFVDNDELSQMCLL